MTYPRLLQPMIEAHLARVGDSQGARDLASVVDRPWFNYRPLPQALRFHASKKRMRFNLGGNRSSKSHALAHEACYHFLGTHPFTDNDNKPMTICYATQNWEMVGLILWKKVRAILEGSDYTVVWHNKGREIPKRLIRHDSRGTSIIEFMAYEQGRGAFQGTEYDYIMCDEQFPQDIYIELISRIGDGKAAKFAASFTPITSQPWLEEKLLNPSADTDVLEFPLDDNRKSAGGFIDDELIDALIEEWPEEIVETRRKGKWASFLGSVYRTFKRSVHVVPVDCECKFMPNGRIPQGAELIGSIDWGAVNPFVFLWAFRVPHMDGCWYVVDEYYWKNREKGQRLIKDHAEAILARTQSLGLELFRTWSDHDAQDRFEMDAAGVPTLPAVKDVIAGIETVQTYLKVRGEEGNKKPRLFISERCVNLVREMSSYRWPDSTKNRDPKDVPVKMEDHCADAVRYLTHSEEKNYGWGETDMHKPLDTSGLRRRF